MFSKEEAQALKKEFWDGFDQHMKSHKPLMGKKNSWTSYKTGVKDIYFRIEVDRSSAKVCIDLQQLDDGIRGLFFEQFGEVKTLLENSVHGELIWLENYQSVTGKEISRLFIELEEVDFYKRKQWLEIYGFLEKNLMALDQFWFEFKDLFKQLY